MAVLADLVILAVTAMKLGGTDYVVKAAGVFFVVSMVPSKVKATV